MNSGVRWSVIAVMVLLAGTVAFAQMPPMDGPGGGFRGPDMDRPGMGMHEPQQGGPGMQPGFGPKGPRDPAMRARREKMAGIRTMAEAYKNLAELYGSQGKTDEGVAQLRKILELASADDSTDDPGISKYLGQVYMEMAEMYLKSDRVSDAEAVLNEGIEKAKTGDVELSSRLALQLGKIQQKAGKIAEAEKSFKRVIELNSSRGK